MTRSDVALRKGIDNTPDADTLDNLTLTAGGLERVRDVLIGAPILISSGYRAPKLNAAVGGSKTSAHVKGLAVDFTAPRFGTPREIVTRLSKFADVVGFDQLILEGDGPGAWVHIGFPAWPTEPRGEILTAKFIGGVAHYTKGIA